MKRFIIYIMLLLPLGFISCNNDDDIDTNNSIFQDSNVSETDVDKWVLENYIYPYNIELKYKFDDNETDVDYDLIPADVDKSIALAKIIKHTWLEAYDEIWGIKMTRTYVPKVIQLIGNVAYTGSGMILGQAEGGLKIMLFNVNNIDVEDIDMNELNEYYLKTMHHEFGHILNQKKPYSPDFERITESGYVGSDWYHYSDIDALQAGFISPYAMDRASEDFVELLSIFLTNTPSAWDEFLEEAGDTGAPIIERKFDIVYKYMKESWGVDLYKFRDVVQRRESEILTMDF